MCWWYSTVQETFGRRGIDPYRLGEPNFKSGGIDEGNEHSYNLDCSGNSGDNIFFIKHVLS